MLPRRPTVPVVVALVPVLAAVQPVPYFRPRERATRTAIPVSPVPIVALVFYLHLVKPETDGPA